MGFFSPSVRKMDENEASLLGSTQDAAGREQQIADALFGMAQGGWQLGADTLGEYGKGYGYSDALLKSIMSGDTSFVDNAQTKKLVNQARGQAQQGFESTKRTLDQNFSNRGIFGGSAQRDSTARLLNQTMAKGLSDQTTQIYLDQAKQKTAEKAAALNNFLQMVRNEGGLGAELTGQGYGAAANAGQLSGQSGQLYADALARLLGRQQDKSWFDKLLGGATGLATGLATGGFFNPTTPTSTRVSV
jgi:hypothetical protein